MKLRRSAALLLALVLLVSALPMSALAAGYYAVINGEQVDKTSHTIYSSEGRIYLSEIEIDPSNDYYSRFDFCEDPDNPRDYIEDPDREYLRHGDSIYVALFADKDDYNDHRPDVMLCLSYSNEEFAITTEPDSYYTLKLSDFDPYGTYALQNNIRKGYLIVESLPEEGTLYYNNSRVSRRDEILLNDISRGKLVYAAPETASADGDQFAFSVVSDLVNLISDAVMYIDLSDGNEAGLPVNAAKTLKLDRNGSYTYDLADFDFHKNTYDIDDFSYIRITTLPEFGYLEYREELIRTSTAIPLADIKAGKLTYTLDNGTDYSAVTADQLKYKVYTAQKNPVYTGTMSMDLSLFSAVGYSYAVKTDTRGERTFRLADFDDPEKDWTAAQLTDKDKDRDGWVTFVSLPRYGDLLLEKNALRTGDDVYLDDIRQGLLKYVPDSATDSAPDSFEFILSDSSGDQVVREEMYIDRTAVRTGVVSYYEDDALVVWMTGKTDYSFTLSDLDNLASSRSLEDYHNSEKEEQDGYIEILTLPDSGKLTLGTDRSARTLRVDDTVTLDEIASGELRYTRDSYVTDAYTSFSFRAYDGRGRLISADAVTVYIDFYETDPYTKGSYSYTVNKATRTVQVTFSDLSVDSSQGVSAGLSAGDLTDLAAEAGFTGGTLELALDVKNSSLDRRSLTLDASLFTDNSKRSVFSNIRVVATDAGQSTSGNAITNVWKLNIPVESIASLYVMSTANFTVELEKYSMTAADKTSLPNKTYNGGLARRVTFYVGNTRVNLEEARLTLPYGKITNKPATVVMMVQQADGSFAPALSSSYNTADNSVSGYCVSGMVCTPYYRGADSGMSFTDLTDPSVSWATSYVYSLSARGVVQGDGTGRYNPTNKVTNAEFIKMLVGSLGLYDATATCSFTDIKGTSSEWAYAYVASAVKAGILTDGGKFNPTATINRQTMSLYGYRASLSAAADIDLPTTYEAENFLDASGISSANRAAVTAMQRAGILQGDGQGHFDPNGTTTRAAAAKIICMLMQYKYQ